ncbi:MAG TPA: sugar transferase [Microcella sp.]|nr:sugar transferase [Microcella sp.]
MSGEPSGARVTSPDEYSDVELPETWADKYSRRLALTDLLVVAWAMFGTQVAWFGLDEARLVGRERLLPVDLSISYTGVTLIIIALWMLVLALFQTRDPRIVGSGTIEYKRIADAAFRLFGVIAILAVLLQFDISRGYFLTGLPVGLAALIFSRWIWRQWLAGERAQGRAVTRAVVVGSPQTAGALIGELAAKRGVGYRVVGACIVGGPAPAVLPEGIELIPGTADIAGVLDRLDADTLIITGADELTADRVRALSWQLEPGVHHLVLAPTLTDIGGPRIHVRPVAGLPLVHVETPRYDGMKRFTKRSFDLVGSAALLLVLSPVLVAIAIAVAVDSRGPVFFTQRRVGLDGRVFSMIKFRSMVPDAESQLGDLLQREREIGNSVLFKMADDPRITRVGRVLRKYSLDELPQLINVFVGQMSLVGPRPPLEREVAAYESHVHRRFFVKPGITGLWQVSGRSTLSWEESVRLDLYYVENWSITTDIVLLWRTVREVVRPQGAF